MHHGETDIFCFFDCVFYAASRHLNKVIGWEGITRGSTNKEKRPWSSSTPSYGNLLGHSNISLQHYRVTPWEYLTLIY
jgi:hypothetical protein